MKKILMGLALAIVLAALFAWIQPSEFRIERSVSIDAPANLVIAQIEDFRRWGAWSPWEKIDPKMRREYGGPASGVGSTYHWVGNEEVGEGRMTITEVRPLTEVGIRLEFITPVAMTNQTTFTLEPVGGGTKLVWAMAGHNDFVGKVVGLFMDMDSVVGGDFEKGLGALAKVCEAEAATWRSGMLEGAEDAAAQEAAAAEAAVLRLGPETP